MKAAAILAIIIALPLGILAGLAVLALTITGADTLFVTDGTTIATADADRVTLLLLATGIVAVTTTTIAGRALRP